MTEIAIMNEKLREIYRHAEALATLSAELNNLTKTLASAMCQDLADSRPSFHLVSLAEIIDEKAEHLSGSCEELSDKLLLEGYKPKLQQNLCTYHEAV